MPEAIARELSRVTQILSATGLYDFQYADEEAKERGSRVHLATHFFDEGDLDWRSVDEADEPFIRGWQEFRRDTQFVPDLIEHPVENTLYQYRGTLDRLGTVKGRPLQVLIDLKTSNSGQISKNVGLQLAAYGFAYDRGRVFDRAAIVLLPAPMNGKLYSVRWFPVPEYQSDVADFLAAVRLARRAERMG